jgi:hypothetical protein
MLETLNCLQVLKPLCCVFEGYGTWCSFNPHRVSKSGKENMRMIITATICTWQMDV